MVVEDDVEAVLAGLRSRLNQSRPPRAISREEKRRIRTDVVEGAVKMKAWWDRRGARMPVAPREILPMARAEMRAGIMISRAFCVCWSWSCVTVSVEILGMGALVGSTCLLRCGCDEGILEGGRIGLYGFSASSIDDTNSSEYSVQRYGNVVKHNALALY